MTTNAELFARARAVSPGGVNSPVRSFQAVGGTPRFIAQGDGAYIWDVEGNRYIDYIGSWGPMILGHRSDCVAAALAWQIQYGTTFGAPCELEVKLAELITSLMPSIEMVRMVNSGTEACMSAVRVARAFTKREKIIKFAGCYHGHADFFLSQAGSGMATLGEPTSPGVPRESAATTLNAEYNDLASVAALFTAHADDVAAVIVEPVVGNMGCVLPATGFLEGLRALCDQHGALLIFDEVMTGFRVALGGAQALFGVRPDLTTLGKIIGGGLPVGAYGGRRDIMAMIAPAGPVYQAGTLSGNPLAMAAGFAQITYLVENPVVYTTLQNHAKMLSDAVGNCIREKSHPASYSHCGSMATLFFSEKPVNSWTSAALCNRQRYARYFWNLMENGIYMPPAQFEAFFHSAAHTDEDIERTASLMCTALNSVF